MDKSSAEESFDRNEDLARTIRSKDVLAGRGSHQYVIQARIMRPRDTEFQDDYFEVKAEILAFRNWQTGKLPTSSVPTRNSSKRQGTELVGYLFGYLLKWPYSFFYDLSRLSREHKELIGIFCDNRGIGGSHGRLSHPLLSEEARRSGNMLHIKGVEIKPGNRGKDLGIQLVQEVLTFLKGCWSLAATVPLQLLDGEWIHEHQDTDGDRMENNRKIQRQFARIGFAQAGRNYQDANIWFVTSSMFFKEDGTESHRWLTREEAKQIDIYTPSVPHEPKGIHRVLHDLIHFYGESCSPILLSPQRYHEISALVQRGASIHEARAIHVAAIYGADRNFFCALCRLGGYVNVPDEYGSRPLHLAAAELTNATTVEALLSMGADPYVKDEFGRTPADKALDRLIKCDEMIDWSETLNSPPNENKVMLTYRTLMAFATPFECTILMDGWMSPRLGKALATISEALLSVLCDSLKFNFNISQAVPISRCPQVVCVLEYIPEHIMSQFLGLLPKCFVQGLMQVLGTIAYALNGLQSVPTTELIRKLIYNVGESSCMTNDYFRLGGRIEYLLDALIGISKNVFFHGRDTSGMTYDDFKHKIECLHSSPVDGMFDMAWIKCITQGGGYLSCSGPYDTFL